MKNSLLPRPIRRIKESASVPVNIQKSVGYNNFKTNFNSFLQGTEDNLPHLHSFKENNKVVLFKQTKKFGLVPQIHSESNLITRVKSKGFGKMISEVKKVDQSTVLENTISGLKLSNSLKVAAPPVDKLYKSVVKIANKFRFPAKRLRCASILYAASQLNSSSSSGFGYNGSKGKNLKRIIYNAKQVLKNPVAKRRLTLSQPMVISWRLQLRKDKITNKVNVKIRPIYMYPGHITLLESIFGLPFICHLQCKKHKGKTPYTIGLNGKNMGQLIKERTSNKFSKQISLDASRWDQSLPNWLIVASFALLRSRLQLTKNESLLFKDLVTYFCSSIVSFKVGKTHGLTIKVGGMPSGSFFTNLIGTICHAILLDLVDPDVVDSDLFSLCSDDNLFSTNKSLRFYAKQYKLIGGIDINTQKCSVSNTNQNIDFMGYSWLGFKRNIDLKLALNQCIFHSTFYKPLDVYEREFSRSASILLNGWNGVRLFKALFPEFVSRLNKGLDVKFVYLYSYGPFESFLASDKNRLSKHSIESLSLHLKHGPDIR